MEQRLVEASRGLVVDILDDSGLAQAGGLEAAFEALVLAVDRLAVDHHGETLLEGERGDIGLAALVFERLRHAGEPECDQAIMGGMGQHRFLLFSVVVATAADVGVSDRCERAFRWPSLSVSPIEAMLEDRGDGAVAARADVVAAPAGGIEPLDAVSLGELQNAEASAEPLFGMWLRPHDRLEPSERCRPDLLGLPHEARGRPLGVAPVRARHVLRDRGVPVLHRREGMAGDARAAMEDLDTRIGDARLDDFTNEAGGDGVEVPGDLHVVIGGDADSASTRHSDKARLAAL